MPGAGIQFTNYVPTSLVGVNSPSPTLAAEAVTGLPITTGAFPGNCFYLTESQANQLSLLSINGAPKMICHAGWYLVVQVDAAANAANIVQGAIGAQKSIASTQAAANQAVPVQVIVTDASAVLSLGQNPVIFLGPVTPGNYTIVQIGGDAKILLSASQAAAVGILLQSTTSGTANVVADGTTVTAAILKASIGIAEEAFNSPAAPLVLTGVAPGSVTAVYGGTITGGTTPNYVGNSFVVTGFANSQNNGTFRCTACSTSTLTLTNPNAVAETHAGLATAVNLLRTNVKFPFGLI